MSRHVTLTIEEIQGRERKRKIQKGKTKLVVIIVVVASRSKHLSIFIYFINLFFLTSLSMNIFQVYDTIRIPH